MGVGKEERKKEKIPRDQEQVCGIRNSDLWLWNESEEPVQRGGGGAEWRGLGSADSSKKKGQISDTGRTFGTFG
jgi:hypothetical protein